MTSLCRLCLKPEEALTGPSGTFVRKLCHCQGGLHQHCAREWSEKTGRRSCNRCQAKYYVELVPRGLWTYIRQSEIANTLAGQKCLRLLNIVHLYLLVGYLLAFVDIPSPACKHLLGAAWCISMLVNINASAHFISYFFNKYHFWQRHHFDVAFPQLDL